MSGATGQVSSAQSRIKSKHVQRNRECKVRTVTLEMNVSTKPSDKPSLPVTRYRSFKMFAAASCTIVAIR